MAVAGNSYTITLKGSHLDWGIVRRTDTRDLIAGEGYIPIPIRYARAYNLLNQNGTNGTDVMGVNLFRCVSADGNYTGLLRAQGAHSAGDIYAKQFSEDGDLKAIGRWYASVNAVVGDRIKVTWIGSTDIRIEKL